MDKAFLSHNSFDKDFVSAVYEKLGAKYCVYDKETFSKNCDLSKQIRDGLEECNTYVLFLSKASLDSGWVQSEIDLAGELRTSWSIKNVLIFQLDSTKWSELPKWCNRYVVSCPPSPEHVALRIKEELTRNREIQETLGRDDDIKEIVSSIINHESTPSFLFISGPDGIGRKSVLRSVYNTIFKSYAKYNIHIKIDSYDDENVLYRKLLSYSANWRLRDLSERTSAFLLKSFKEKIDLIAELIRNISVEFNQILYIDIGNEAIDNENKTAQWLISLLKKLQPADYPYLVILSNRYISLDQENGIFYNLKPLTEENSKYLFQILLKTNNINIPSKAEKENIENSVSGHPGLMTKIIKYLKSNPTYRPSKTHSNITQMIKIEVERMLLDFIKEKKEILNTIYFFGETDIISYSDAIALNEIWPDFAEHLDSLIDAGFINESSNNYQLVNYLQRFSKNISPDSIDHELIKKARFNIFKNFEKDNDGYIDINILDSRIISYLSLEEECPEWLSNLIMPAQQIKASKREYDSTRYSKSLKLAKSAYDQSTKLSDSGKIEAWRLIGLSSIRLQNPHEISLFENEYSKLADNNRKKSTYHFVNGLKYRLQGNLRDALEHYEKVKELNKVIRQNDSHSLREIAYIYVFDNRIDEAYEITKELRKLSPTNPYSLDIEALVLLEKYKKTKDFKLIEEIESCLERLENADKREQTNFYPIRKSTYEVIAGNKIDSLRLTFQNRSKLPILSKISLLSLLSSKGKNEQYIELYTELSKLIASSKNKLAEIELAKTNITHNAYNGDKSSANEELKRYKIRFTDQCISELMRLI